MKHDTYHIVRRLDWIKSNLDAGINCTDIAARWDCSIKTAARDIKFLRNYYGLRIEYNESKKTFNVPGRKKDGRKINQ
jgi:hypothetical protein